MMGQPLSRLWSAAPLCKGSQCAGKSLPLSRGAFCGGTLPTKLVHFDWLKRESLISIKKEPGTRIASRLSLVVPLTGLEPVRILLRGILSPLCLPIPPQRQVDGFT